MNKINDFLTKAAKEPNFADASIFLEQWYKAIQATPNPEATPPEAAKILNLQRIENRNMEKEVSSVVLSFLEDSNLKDIKKLVFSSVTQHLANKTLFHTEEHQSYLENFNEIHSLLSDLSDIKSHFIENDFNAYQRHLQETY